jgi:uracil-DNA glycosylase family 4
MWKEAETPGEAVDCTRCELAKQRTRIIWGEGNESAPVAAVLDNPGAREDREGSPFVCATRVTLQRAVADIGWSEEQIFVTYLLKCRRSANTTSRRREQRAWIICAAKYKVAVPSCCWASSLRRRFWTVPIRR